MHKIMDKEFNRDDFSHDHMTHYSLIILENTINALNELRSCYLNWDSINDATRKVNEWNDKKDIWWQMIQLLPSSYNQTRNVMMNYEVLANIYKSRKDHKLDEWREFCKWIEMLPWSELICDWDMNEEPKEKIEDFSKVMNSPEGDDSNGQ